MRTITKRRLIYGAFIFVFLVIAPALILYAFGFRYSTKIGIIQRTGAIVVDTQPEDVEVYLDDRLVTSIESKRITQLLPQEYDVRISKEGYFDWQRSVVVKSFEVVFLTHIQLFRDYVFPEFIEILPDEIIQPPRPRTTDLEGSHEFRIFKTSESYYLELKNRLTQTATRLARLPRSDYLFVNAPEDWVALSDTLNHMVYLFQLSKDHRSVLQRFVISGSYHIDWDKTGQRIVYDNPFEIWVLDVNSGKRELITRLSSGIKRSLWHPSGSYIIYQSKNAIRIIEYTEAVDRQNYVLIELPAIQEMLINEQGDVLYVDAVIANQAGWYRLVIQ